MEYVDGGELFHYVDERNGLREDETVYIFRQIVSALLYCHRLLICHRDLKPENILLNQDDLTVKLIDFGMAALQPQGRLLSTPCGSPHYAAPEVVSSRPYDGKQADVWSCGVILYVMLTGSTPYNYTVDGDIRPLFRDIAKARYFMPDYLSDEAQDLIRRIFVPDPKRRITMDEVWQHPLLHKYDKVLGLDGPDGTKEAAIGPIPTLGDFRLKRIQDIDREILRNMRTLWHSEPEQSLVQKLLSSEINQEKLFYAALIKHREENLENYSGSDEMDYSKSDYHHIQPNMLTDAPPLPPGPAQRTQSQYSILNDEHLRSSASQLSPPPLPAPSVSSYDPYRSSKVPIVDATGDYVNVVVHRQESNRTRMSVAARSLRHPNSLRVEKLKQGNGGKRTSKSSSSSLARSGRSRSTLHRSSVSHQSMFSSGLPSSPPVIATMRPSDLHKRGVSFAHLRRTSSASHALTTPCSGHTTPTPSLPDASRKRGYYRPSNPQPLSSSPPPTPLQQHQIIRSKKARATLVETPKIKVRRSDTPSQHIRNDIRKHSAELEKACEDAFFRSSVGSSLTAQTTTFSEHIAQSETPPSSVSRNGSGGMLDDVEIKPPSRRFPSIAGDTPNTYLTRTLEETRNKLAAYRPSEDANAARFDEVVRLLEEIMPATRPASQSGSKRIASAPDPKLVERSAGVGFLDDEERGRGIGRDGLAGGKRSVTSPLQTTSRPPDRTIRLVPSSSPPAAIAPLRVHKYSGANDQENIEPESFLSDRKSSERSRHGRIRPGISALPSIHEDSTLTSTPTVIRKKRSAWFGLSKKVEEPDDRAAGHAATTSGSAHNMSGSVERKPSRRLSKQPPNLQSFHEEESPASARSSEFPIRKKKSGTDAATTTTNTNGNSNSNSGKKSFTRWLSRKDADRIIPKKTPSKSTDAINGATYMSMDSLFSSGSSTDEHIPTSSSSSGPERSWFARFFHIKPASKILCFSIPRGRARKELTRLLREWERHGLRDVQCSRHTNTISARVDRQNALSIKPVSFRVELFVVLEHGRRAGLSIARFVQTKGAAQAFRRTVDVVDEVMRSRDWLVTDDDKWRALCDVVGNS